MKHTITLLIGAFRLRALAAPTSNITAQALAERKTPRLESFEVCRRNGGKPCCCKHSHGHRHEFCYELKGGEFNCPDVDYDYGPFCCEKSIKGGMFSHSTHVCPDWMQH